MSKDINSIVGWNIKKVRNDLNITQVKLWELSWISRTALSQIETGDKSPTIKTLELIANALEVDIKDLFNNENTNK